MDRFANQNLDELAKAAKLPNIHWHYNHIVTLYNHFLNCYNKEERKELLNALYDFSKGMAAACLVEDPEPYKRIYNQIEKER
jgi:hypothetical protein